MFTGKSTPTKTALLVQEKSRLRRAEGPKTLNGEEGNIPQRLWMIPVRTLLVEQKQLPPFSLIRDFGKQNTREKVSKISVSLACYRQIGSESTNHSPSVTFTPSLRHVKRTVIGEFRSDLSITCMIDGNFGNVSAGILFSKVAYQGKRW